MPSAVELRETSPADTAPCLDLLNDPETTRWAAFPSPASPAEAGGLLEQQEPFHVLAIDVGGFAGIVRLRSNGNAAADLELAIHPSYRERGIGIAALRAAVDWAFEELGAPAVTWRMHVGDYRAWRIAWCNGFTYAATMPASLDQRGTPQDAWVATLARSHSREPTTAWIKPARIELDDLLIRPQLATDETRFLEAMNDPASHLWLGTITSMPRTVDEFRASMRRYLLSAALGEAITWTVADRRTDAYLGSVSLFGLTGLDYKSAEVGYRTHPDARGRGVLTRSLRAVIGHAFTWVDEGGLGLERISLGAGDGNLASQGVARSCGFTETGRDRRCYDLSDGTIVDLIRFDLLRSEFVA